VEACPFGAMQFSDRTEVAVKCDLCIDRLDTGRKPACLSVCPTGCIRMGTRKSIATVFESASGQGENE
jgi:Fe-S-cluster-containing dehydrogenase component